jgi:replicative DNA helicase
MARAKPQSEPPPAAAAPKLPKATPPPKGLRQFLPLIRHINQHLDRQLHNLGTRLARSGKVTEKRVMAKIDDLKAEVETLKQDAADAATRDQQTLALLADLKQQVAALTAGTVTDADLDGVMQGLNEVDATIKGLDPADVPAPDTGGGGETPPADGGDTGDNPPA